MPTKLVVGLVAGAALLGLICYGMTGEGGGPLPDEYKQEFEALSRLRASENESALALDAEECNHDESRGCSIRQRMLTAAKIWAAKVVGRMRSTYCGTRTFGRCLLSAGLLRERNHHIDHSQGHRAA